jgi:uncharacterized protein (DUF433 family)
MSQIFDRIKRDVNKFGGQPYIDQTNITVKQILTSSMSGASVDDILVEFPDLSIDDIHQALNFVIQDIFNGVSYWRHDGITPLTQIKGYSEILVGKTEFDDLDTIPDEQKHQWMTIIHSSSQRGIARWQQMSQWLSKRYRAEVENSTEDFQIEKFIINIVSIAQNYEPSLEIDVSSFDSQININTHTDTALMLGSILAFAKNTFIPETHIKLSVEEDLLAISIHRQLLYPDDNIQKLLNTPYSPVSTATTFFYQQDIPFRITRDDDIVIFTAKLPISID